MQILEHIDYGFIAYTGQAWLDMQAFKSKNKGVQNDCNI